MVINIVFFRLEVRYPPLNFEYELKKKKLNKRLTHYFVLVIRNSSKYYTLFQQKIILFYGQHLYFIIFKRNIAFPTLMSTSMHVKK